MSHAPGTSAAAPATGARTSPADMAVLRWLVAATFIVILNETIMINAIPDLKEHFGVGNGAAQWLTTAFMLTMAVVIPVTGWFLQRVTTRQAFGLAMAVFCTGTLLAAVTPASMFWLLIVARVIQATGTAVMMPLLMTTLMNVVPETDRGRVMGNVTLAMSVAPALGPAVSGLILSTLSWRWMFGLVLPIAALIGLAGLRRLKNVGEPTAGSIDVVSVVLSAIGFGGLVYGLSLIGKDDAAVSPYLLIGGAAVVLALFVWRQVSLQRGGSPLLDLRTLTHPTYAKALVLMAFAFMGFLGSMLLIPLYLQDVRGLTPLQTGLLMMPGGLAMGLLGPTVGKAFDRVGGRPLVIPGSIGITIALGLFTQVGTSTPYALILGAHILLMISLACVFTPVFTLGLGAVPPQLYSHASSLLGTLQQVAGAMGAALSVAVLTARGESLAKGGASGTSAYVGGMQWAFALSAVLSVVVIVLAVLLPGRLPQTGGPVAPIGDDEIDDLLDDAEAVPAG
ncbi:MDR family MFS transporter [Marmoricola sp. RAF53]|uniref:MDR family MFS transporter n=1 Tax=Marmoricola sp. RAF53 TaxID=3233059 RepID=UPI003F9C0D49